MDGSLAPTRTRLRAACGRLGSHDSYRDERLATAQNRSSLNFQTGSQKYAVQMTLDHHADHAPFAG
uniref:Uncharacterized protein n=1 Tax=Ralstonia solanacearum TaxID=305 RepID=A0A0S4UWF6_RALSL|nr:protein of unknown function [Ralstonia solanacearum]CUV34742.1 protein of unknown function [Ralstonia solanacearum]CUV40152.1 protein of unknown function [Ralstonia solanacearum]